MKFEADDFDWAYGELLNLFARANRLCCKPHDLDPDLFYSAWSLLNAQPFEVRERCQKTLMGILTRREIDRTSLPKKRYENAWAK